MKSDHDHDTLFGIFDDTAPLCTESKQDRTLRHFAEANASLALEGYTVPKEILAIQHRVAAGEITHDEAVSIITEMYTNKAAKQA